MQTSLFDYHLPQERIAQEPNPERDSSRLLVVERTTQAIEHRRFSDLPEYLNSKDCLFRNAAKVLPARIFAQRPTGGHVECLLLRPGSGDAHSWWCLLRPGRKLPPRSTFSQEGEFEAEVLEKNEEAEYLVRFDFDKYGSVADLAESLGKMPLPPYIHRDKIDSHDSADINRYQTTYANQSKMVAAAAPTAGLHFTPELSQRLESKGVSIHDLILHVGMGTFKPIESDHIEDHAIHREVYEIPAASKRALLAAPSAGKRRICIGTTSMRTIEDYLSRKDDSPDETHFGEADIFIYPPNQFLGVDALVTNFHMPKSTLLCLVSSFLTPGKTDGIDWLKAIYQEAIDREYRFFSYGDAMLIL